MDFWDLTKVVIRRWYISVPLVALTAALCVLTWKTARPDYNATSYVQLTPPTQDPTKTATEAQQIVNPWMTLGITSLSNSAKLVTLDSTFLKSLKDGGYSENVSMEEGFPNPTVTIYIVGNSEQQVRKTTDLVMSRYEAAVQQLQVDQGVRPSSMIKTFELGDGPNIEESRGKVKRAALAVGAVGLLLAVGLTMWVDAAARRRKRRATDEIDPGLAGPDPLAPRSPLPPSFPSGTAPEALRRPVAFPMEHRIPAASPHPASSDDAPTIVVHHGQGLEVSSSTEGQTDSTLVLPLSFGNPATDRPRR
jgi:hypothetical protein